MLRVTSSEPDQCMTCSKLDGSVAVRAQRREVLIGHPSIDKATPRSGNLERKL